VSAVVATGLLLLFGGIAMHRRAVVLLLDRWRTLRPRDWAEAMRPTQRAFPFKFVLRWQIVHDNANLWHWSTPVWALDEPHARKLLLQLRLSPLVAVLGGAIPVATGITA
jgi:hypothetical protein